MNKIKTELIVEVSGIDFHNDDKNVEGYLAIDRESLIKANYGVMKSGEHTRESDIADCLSWLWFTAGVRDTLEYWVFSGECETYKVSLVRMTVQ